MTIAICESFELERYQAIHDFTADVIKIALFDGDAAFDNDTTAYSTTDEVTTGDGYTTGGATLTVTSTYPKIESGRVAVRFDDPSWTFTATKAVQWALVYNSSKSNRAILSIDLGQEYSIASTLSLTFPSTLPALLNSVVPAA